MKLWTRLWGLPMPCKGVGKNPQWNDKIRFAFEIHRSTLATVEDELREDKILKTYAIIQIKKLLQWGR